MEGLRSTFKVDLSKEAIKNLEDLSPRLQEKIYEALERLKENPFWSLKIKKLKGALKGKYRYRIGELRIVYEVDKVNKVIRVISIGSREDIY